MNHLKRTANQIALTYFNAVTMTPADASRRLSAARSRRGATFIEYAILAGIAVALGAIIYGGLSGVFSSLWAKITSFVNTPSSN